MDPTGKTFASENPRKWIGRILMAVILGEAIWNLIVSVMNNLVVPWLGDLFGQSSGLPTSFTQRPYNYPDLFVSILEFCIAALVAAIINYFFQRPRPVRGKTMKSAAPIAPVEPLRVVPEVGAPAATPRTAPSQSLMPQTAMPQTTTPQPAMTKTAVTQTTPPVAPVTKSVPVAPPPPVTVAPPMPAAPVVAPGPVAKPVAVAPAAPSVPISAAKPQPPPPPKAQPAKPTKTKEVYYNIVGEPMPSDDE